MSKLYFVDTETGGLDPSIHSLLQVAVAVWENGEVIDSISINIYHDNYVVTSEALKVNKIDLTKQGENSLEVWEAGVELRNFFKQHSNNFQEAITFAGHNVNFDIGFLKANFQGLFHHKAVSHRTVDTASIARFLRDCNKIPPEYASLDSLAKHLNFGEQDHTALGDVLMTIKVYEKFLDLIVDK